MDWYGDVPFGREPVLDLRLPSALGMVSNALLRMATGGAGAIKTSLVAMPALCFKPTLAAEAIGWQLFLVPFIVSFLFPLGLNGEVFVASSTGAALIVCGMLYALLLK